MRRATVSPRTRPAPRSRKAPAPATRNARRRAPIPTTPATAARRIARPSRRRRRPPEQPLLHDREDVLVRVDFAHRPVGQEGVDRALEFVDLAAAAALNDPEAAPEPGILIFVAGHDLAAAGHGQGLAELLAEAAGGGLAGD